MTFNFVNSLKILVYLKLKFKIKTKEKIPKAIALQKNNKKK